MAYRGGWIGGFLRSELIIHLPLFANVIIVKSGKVAINRNNKFSACFAEIAFIKEVSSASMPLEIKRIYFTESEIRIALTNFSVRRKRYMELGDIKEMLVDKNSDKVQISFLMNPELAIKGNRISFSHAEVAAALLALSMMSKIPLPRTGEKELRMSKDKIYLQIIYGKPEKVREYIKPDTAEDAEAFLI